MFGCHDLGSILVFPTVSNHATVRALVLLAGHAPVVGHVRDRLHLDDRGDVSLDPAGQEALQALEGGGARVPLLHQVHAPVREHVRVVVWMDALLPLNSCRPA